MEAKPDEDEDTAAAGTRCAPADKHPIQHVMIIDTQDTSPKRLRSIRRDVDSLERSRTHHESSPNIDQSSSWLALSFALALRRRPSWLLWLH